MTRLTASIADEDLNTAHKRALFGDDLINAEIALRARSRVVDLRGSDLPPSDPWLLAQRDAALNGRAFDAVAAAGMQAVATMFGDPFERERIRREQATAREQQRDQYVVAIGSTVVLRSGAMLREGAPVTLDTIDHPHGAEVLGELVARGIVSEVDPHVAWLRGLPASVGPYVVAVEAYRIGDRTLQRGDSVHPEMFPAPAPVRAFGDDEPIATMTAGELRELVLRTVMPYVPAIASGPPTPTPLDIALMTRAIVSAPNYRPEASAAAGTQPKKGSIK